MIAKKTCLCTVSGYRVSVGCFREPRAGLSTQILNPRKILNTEKILENFAFFRSIAKIASLRRKSHSVHFAFASIFDPKKKFRLRNRFSLKIYTPGSS